jgi:hypothetical protein
MRRISRILAPALAVLLAPASATAWVAVGVGPRFVGAAAVGIAAGAVAGAAVASSRPQTVVVQPPPAPVAPLAVGQVVTALPAGCATVGSRYQCGATWFQPYFGGNGVYYQVVAP